jgi:hypothetical protein
MVRRSTAGSSTSFLDAWFLAHLGLLRDVMGAQWEQSDAGRDARRATPQAMRLPLKQWRHDLARVDAPCDRGRQSTTRKVCTNTAQAIVRDVRTVAAMGPLSSRAREHGPFDAKTKEDTA